MLKEKERRKNSLSFRKCTAILLSLILIVVQFSTSVGAAGFVNNEQVGFMGVSQRSYGQSAVNLGKGNTGKTTIEADITPLISNQNSYLAFSDVSTSLNPNKEIDEAFNMIVNLSSDGTFYVYNGSSFQALNSVSFVNNTTYHIKIESDVSAKKYSVWVTEGTTTTQIANNYDFSTTGETIDDIGQVCLYSPSKRGASKVENLVVYPTPSSVSSESIQTIYPEKTYAVLHNPGMGWVYYVNAVSDFSDLGTNGTFSEVDNIGIVSTWAEIEATEGVYYNTTMNAFCLY